MFLIKELLEGYAGKKFSPVEITRQYLDRANEYSHLNAFITITEEIALQQAKIAEKRWMLGEAGRLEGIPVSYKDNIHTKGVPTTSGSIIDREFVPNKNAKLVENLNREGAVMIGKANMHEFAFGITNNNPFYGPSRNPWNLELISGGSSGGGAVSVAADLVSASIGTDTGGSVRIPASCCGLFGLKPTHGLLDSNGVTLISWNLDHLGPITRNVSDLAIMVEALTGKNVTTNLLNSQITNLRGLKVGVPINYFTDHIEDEVLHLFKRTLQQFEELGAVLIDVEVPYAEEALPLTFTLAAAEAGFVHKERMALHIDRYGQDVRHVLESSSSISAVDYIEALQRKQEITKACDELLEKIDVLITPALPALPKPIGQEEVIINGQSEPIFNCMIRYTSYFNLTGHPALSLPAGLTNSKLPVGVQIVAGKRKEKQLIEAAKVYEEHYLDEFYQQRPHKSLIL
ncbi:amidase [Neobacillus mesonae]|uniref:amidase n=1 Tax=Neobacillus mesonae TaxID=1193713 RepID=UPI00203B6475|nr:amidase [Neobacillus mesonae]MCM3569936.1 amidase [Neobacillus mesonae]